MTVETGFWERAYDVRLVATVAVWRCWYVLKVGHLNWSNGYYIYTYGYAREKSSYSRNISSLFVLGTTNKLMM